MLTIITKLLKKLDMEKENITAAHFRDIIRLRYNPNDVEFIWRAEFEKHARKQQELFLSVLKTNKIPT